MSTVDTPSRLAAALAAIADGTPVDWRDVDAAGADAADRASLQLLDDVARAFRGSLVVPATRPAPALFHWQGLAVRERIGAGSYGEVFRAYDPWLEREVALKLSSPGGGTRLDEARRLARVRQHNVLAVYGCGIDGGRAGLWSELIDGRTLADIVARDGPLAAEEALRIGRDLACALAAVHAAGLVHGDVKAENVMRERGGRIVLMDFGAGGDANRQAGRSVLTATLAYLSPEVLDGAPLSVASDLHALGVLLYLLRTGTLPWSAPDAPALRAAQRAQPRVALPAPERALDARLHELIAAALAPDPAQRPRSAADVAADLSRAAHPLPPPAPPIARWRHAALALAVAAAGSTWFALRPPPALVADAAFVRVTPAGEQRLAVDAAVRVGDRLRLLLRSNRTAWVYVLNEDADGTATVLFPLDAAGYTNPLAPDAALALPGGSTDSTLAWEVTADSRSEEFLVVAAASPLPAFETAIADWRRARAQRRERSVGAVVSDTHASVTGPQLQAALAALPTGQDAPQRWHYVFPHAK